MNNTFSDTFKKKDAEHLVTYKEYARSGFLFTIGTFYLLGGIIARKTQGVNLNIYIFISILEGVGMVTSFLHHFYLTPNKLKQWRNYREKMWDEGKLSFPMHEVLSPAPSFVLPNFLGLTAFFLAGFGTIALAPNNNENLKVHVLAECSVFLVLTFVSLSYFESKFKRDTRSFIESKEVSLFASNDQNQRTAPDCGAVNQV